MGKLANKLKKHARRIYIPMAIVAAICSLLGLVHLGSSVSIRMNQFKEMSEYTETQLQTSEYYKLSDYNYIFDYFAEDDEGGYFLILRPQDMKWMGLYLKGADKKKAEEIIEDNDKYLSDKTDRLSDSTISVKGLLRSMESDESSCFRNYLESAGFSSAEISQTADFRTLDTSKTDTASLIGGTVISLIGLIWLLVCFRNILGSSYVKKVETKIAERGMNPEQVMASFENCSSFRNIDITPSFAILHGLKAKLVPYDELIWVYKQVKTTTHKYYGIIPSGITVEYNIVLVDRMNQAHSVECKNDLESEQIIHYISGYAPYLIAGYSDTIARAAQANFSQMVQYVDQRRDEETRN